MVISEKLWTRAHCRPFYVPRTNLGQLGERGGGTQRDKGKGGGKNEELREREGGGGTVEAAKEREQTRERGRCMGTEATTLEERMEAKE